MAVTLGPWVGPPLVTEEATGQGELEITVCDGGSEIPSAALGRSCPAPKRPGTGGTTRCGTGKWLLCPTVGCDTLDTVTHRVVGSKLTAGLSGNMAMDPLR